MYVCVRERVVVFQRDRQNNHQITLTIVKQTSLPLLFPSLLPSANGQGSTCYSELNCDTQGTSGDGGSDPFNDCCFSSAFSSYSDSDGTCQNCDGTYIKVCIFGNNFSPAFFRLVPYKRGFLVTLMHPSLSMYCIGLQ